VAANLESEIRKMYEVGGRRFRVALLATEVTASRRSYAKLCHSAGGELEQIQFLLGHVSVQTTERYLGCKQRISGAVNDRIGIEP
jgi:integrase